MDMQKMTIGEIIELIQSTETATFKLEGLGETTISTIELKLFVDAYKKQIPKPLKHRGAVISCVCCPTCGRLYFDEILVMPYCDMCGQKLREGK